MLTVKTFRLISLCVLLLAVVLSIGGVSMARFIKASFETSSAQVELALTIGAFHACLDFSGTSDSRLSGSFTACAAIESDCTVNILGSTVPPKPHPDYYSDGCDKFNAFRAILVTAIMMICFAAILGAVQLAVNRTSSPKWSTGLEIVFIVLSGLASVLFIGSLIALDQTASALPSGGFRDDDNNSLSVKVEKYTSFALEGTAVAFLLVSLILWIVARFVGKQPEAQSLEGMPLTGDSSPTAYAQLAPGQPQPLFNYGAPPPQPNYQYGNTAPQYGNQPSQPGMPPPQQNYGFGYQPPPPTQY